MQHTNHIIQSSSAASLSNLSPICVDIACWQNETSLPTLPKAIKCQWSAKTENEKIFKRQMNPRTRNEKITLVVQFKKSKSCKNIYIYIYPKFHRSFVRVLSETVAKELWYDIRFENHFSLAEWGCIKSRTVRTLPSLHAPLKLVGLWPHTHSSVHRVTCAAAGRPAHDREMESSRFQSIAFNCQNYFSKCVSASILKWVRTFSVNLLNTDGRSFDGQSS